MESIQSKCYLLLLRREYDTEKVYNELLSEFDGCEINVSREMYFPDDLKDYFETSTVYKGDWYFNEYRTDYLLLQSKESIDLFNMLNMISSVVYETNLTPIHGIYKKDNMLIIDVE